MFDHTVNCVHEVMATRLTSDVLLRFRFVRDTVHTVTSDQ